MRNTGEKCFKKEEEEEKMGFQGAENIDIEAVKDWIATYFCYNKRFASVEERKDYINGMYAKVVIFFEMNDLPLVEEQIAEPNVSKKLNEWVKKSEQEIENIMEEMEKNPSVTDQFAPVADTKKPCSCQEHAGQKGKMTTMECFPLILLAIAAAYFILQSLRLFYYVAGAILVLYFGKITYHKWKDKKAKEEAE